LPVHFIDVRAFLTIILVGLIISSYFYYYNEDVLTESPYSLSTTLNECQANNVSKKLKKGAIKKFVLRKIPSKIDIIHDHTFNSALGKARLRIQNTDPKALWSRDSTVLPSVCTIQGPAVS